MFRSPSVKISKTHVMSKNEYTPEETDAIKRLAYIKWLRAGKPQGDGKRFWLEAEWELTFSIVTIEEVDYGLPSLS